MKKTMDSLAFSRDACAFIVKRAYRRGYVYPGDVCRACDISPAGATRAMAQAKNQYGAYLIKQKAKLLPRVLEEAPEFAGEKALFAALDMGYSDPAVSGLFKHELPTVYTELSQRMPLSPGVMTEIVQAIADQKQIEIVIQNMGIEEGMSVHYIYPLALERAGDEWRLIAQKYTSPDVLTAFSLVTILRARRITKRLPSGFVARSDVDRDISLQVVMNPRYTSDQCALLGKIFSIENDVIKIASRAQSLFESRFGEVVVQNENVMPVFVSIESAEDGQ